MSYGYQYRDPLESLAKGMQIRAMVENIKAQREARAQAAQLHQLEIEQHQRNQAADQFKMMMTLQQMGAIPAATGDTGANDAAISEAIGGISPENRRPFAQTPIGAYRLPSRMDVARTKGQTAAAEAEAEDPSVSLPIPEELQSYVGATTQKVPQSKAFDYALKIAGAIQKQKPDKKISPPIINKDTGDATIWSYDPSSDEVKIEKVLPGAGGLRPPAKTASGGLTPYQQIQTQRAVKRDVQGAIDKAQAAIDSATALDTSTRKPKDPNTSPEWKAARIATERAAQLYPDAIEAGVDANGYPYVKPKAQVATTATAATTAPAATVAPPKVGDVRTVRGKRMTITKVYPDGSFDAK